MGTPIDCDTPLIEYGSDCSICTELWKPGQTPKKVHCVFKDIVKCPGWPGYPDPPNDQVFILEQSPYDPCTWLISPASGWAVAWTPNSVWSALQLLWLPESLVYFRADILTPCSLEQINIASCVTETAYGGSGKIWWEPDNIPLEITCHLGFHHMSGNLFDRVQCGIDHQVIRIANKFDKTNCLFYVDNEVFSEE